MEQTMNAESINHWLEKVVAEHGPKTALTFLRNGQAETAMTFAQLQRDVNRFANALMDLGVQKGDRVILFIPKSVIAVVAHFALQTIGAMAVPLNPGFKKNEMAYLLGDADAKLIIVEPGKKRLVQDIDPKAQLLEISTAKPYQNIEFFRSASATVPAIDIYPDDPGLVIYTSGTTGNPKGAVLTHRNLVSDARNIIRIWEITADDVLCHALPLFHVHGLCFALHTALLSGAHVRLLDQFQPESVVAELSRNTDDAVCSVFMAVPAMYTKLMDFLGDQQLDFSHMRLFTSGSAPLLIKEFERMTKVFGLEPVEREGMSETGMNFSNPLTCRRIPGSIGIPLPGLQVRIVDPDTLDDVAPGEVGELWLKSAAITPGYWRKPQETADTFMDGWFRTGDLGKIDADGYYYLTDRIKHIIISGGENVSAKEVETIINQIEGVNESVLVGKPDQKWGEKVVAAVTLKPGAQLTEADIKAFCKTHLHDWKCPKEIIFMEAIPRNTMGKVLKEEVRKMFLK
jgi:malonyl-CoA/methylmalonyl-CoA synthetase